ncbi:hypothetical protein O3P69_008746 [Scylla paramamosain]|uniref:Neurotransmitter-gated ion-channel ligand-binding domain-containing protein n=1 Tax=Scylla paramamosain TaxID=85552 RepID=A0AAW0SLF0_SCYPA
MQAGKDVPVRPELQSRSLTRANTHPRHRLGNRDPCLAPRKEESRSHRTDSSRWFPSKLEPRGNDVKSSSQEFNYTEERRGTEAAGRTDGLGEVGERRRWRGGEGLCSEDEERLVRDLFRGYNKLIRPVENMTNNVDVAFGLAFIQLINVNEKNQIMKSNVWLRLMTDFRPPSPLRQYVYPVSMISSDLSCSSRAARYPPIKINV